MQREAAALAQVTARATALEGQIADLEASRGAGLDVAQAALTECVRAGDEAGAKTAAEAVARIEAAASAVTVRVRPLQLQLAEVVKLKDAAAARVQQAEADAASADGALFDAKLEALALARDEAAMAFQAAHIAYEAANVGARRRNKKLPVEISIGASHKLLTALGKRVDASISVTDSTMRREVEPISESIFNEDPLALESDAEKLARERNHPSRRPLKIDKARQVDRYAQAHRMDFATACKHFGVVDLGFDVEELESLRTAEA